MGRMVRFSPKAEIEHQKARADVGQGKMAKKSEPDPEPAVEEKGMADGDGRTAGEVRGACAAAAPRCMCQLPRGLRTMPCPEHRQELLLPQL